MESRALSVKIKQGEDMTQHTIQADRSTTVLDMKQQIFSEYMRFICQGRELRDHELVFDCRLPQDVIIHAVKSNRSPTTEPPPAVVSEADPEWLKYLGSPKLLLMLLGLFLAIMWVTLISYGGIFFGANGILLLLVLTFSWGAGTYLTV